jgi:hypothetical protein
MGARTKAHTGSIPEVELFWLVVFSENVGEGKNILIEDDKILQLCGLRDHPRLLEVLKGGYEDFQQGENL